MVSEVSTYGDIYNYGIIILEMLMLYLVFIKVVYFEESDTNTASKLKSPRNLG